MEQHSLNEAMIDIYQRVDGRGHGPLAVNLAVAGTARPRPRSIGHGGRGP